MAVSKLKLLPRTTIKAKSLTRFPANVTGTNGISVTQSGADYTIALSGTNALASAGTTGSVAYYSSANTIAAAAVITENAFVIGGTTGQPPVESTLVTTVPGVAAVNVAPTALSIQQGINITQTGPATGTMTAPLIYNQTTVDTKMTVTAGAAWPEGYTPFYHIGHHVLMTAGGSALKGAAIPVFIRLLHTEDSASDADFIGQVVSSYINAQCGSGGAYGMDVLSVAGASAVGSNLVGLNIESKIDAAASIGVRSGLRLQTEGAGNGGAIDAAITVCSNGSNTWTDFCVFNEFSEGQCISSSGSLFKAFVATTFANIFNMSNVTVTGNILSFPNITMKGSGVIQTGAGTFSATTGYLVQVSVTSGGTTNLASRADSSTGYNGLDTYTSTGNNQIALLANEASRTATMFGITVGNYNQIVSLGSSSNGLLVGTTVNKPFVLGTNDIERMRITGGGQVTVGPTATPVSGVTLTVNANTVAPAAITNTGGVVLQVTGANSTQAGILLDSFGASATSEGFITLRTARGTQASPTATQSGDFLGFLGMIGATGAGTFGSNTGGAGGIFFGGKATENWDATHQGARIEFYATATGSAVLSNVATMQSGLQIGAPTGGDKGAGTINVATNIYLNNAAYTNPDYALEHYFTGKIDRFADNLGAENYAGLMPLADLGAYLRDNLRLPGIDDEPCGIFTRADIALEKIEEAMIYILQLDERLARIEGETK